VTRCHLAATAGMGDRGGCGSRRPGLRGERDRDRAGTAGPGSRSVSHLYVHLPFCAGRCGYCDFVTLVGGAAGHGRYVDALLAELELERDRLAPQLETVFLGGGTPTYTQPEQLARLLTALPGAAELTVEANPETVTPELAALLRAAGVSRVSLGAQSFQERLLDVLERRARPGDVRRSVQTLRDAGFDNISLDLLYGVPGQSAADLESDLRELLALAPEHVSYYELEAKAGTRFAHAHGDELERQRDAMETYLERVVERLTAAGYRWYETSSFARLEPGRDLRAQHNLGYWRADDYLGIGIGAVSTVDGIRWRNRPALRRYGEALTRGDRPPREIEVLSAATRLEERLMLRLRLDEPLPLREVAPVVDPQALERLERGGLVRREGGAIVLTARGRPLGGGVTAELLADPERAPALIAV
jgi:putative oxygen-independent coproporphyrinogen III oxidase